MGLRRYAIFYAPIEHLNGKYQKADYKCSFQPASDSNGKAYYYGYRRNNKARSYVAFRDKCRNLSVHPVGIDEEDNMSYMRSCVGVVHAVYKQLPRDGEPYLSYKKQRKYATFWNYCVAYALNHGGNFPFPETH
ncbi:MAG: hypothetical protein AUK64_2306 [bacterium P201]|nr:MAG: hypothetical protein AUK64_2306 [bacterium P201]